MVALVTVILIALIFDFINGFHDAANSIATVVSTRVLSPRAAVAWAAFFNFVAFLFFETKVAGNISKGVHPEVVTLVVSIHDEDVYAERVLRAGGRGYVMKQQCASVLMQAIRRILNGECYFSERFSSKLLDLLSGRRGTSGSSPIDQLSDREFEVFRLVGNGVSTLSIADQLKISCKTVEAHRARSPAPRQRPVRNDGKHAQRHQ